MADNKFILRLKGAKAAASVVEVKNDDIVAPYADIPNSSNVGGDGIIDDKDSSVVVAKGAQNWKVNGGSLVPTDVIAGNGQDYTSERNVAGASMWLNASYSFPPTGIESQPVAQVFLAHSKWVLKLCGKNLLTTSGDTIEFTFVVKVGPNNIASQTITVAKQANFFCKKFIVDFSESAKEYIAAYGGTDLTLQLFCSDENASATIFNGMTVLTLLERKVDATAVASQTRVLGTVFDEGLLPSEYFSNGNFIDQVADDDTASPVFKRDGAQMKLDGWVKQQDMSNLATKEEVTQAVATETTRAEAAEAALQQEIDTNAGKTAELDADLQGKVDKAQGVENTGKFLKVGEDGNVILGDVDSGVTEVAHDDTLSGKGTTEEPLSVVKPAAIIREW